MKFSHQILKRSFYTTGVMGIKSFDSIPGPKPAPLIGNMWRFFPFIGTYANLESHEINLKQHMEFGDLIRLRDLKVRPDLILCFDPDDIEMIYRHEGVTPKRGFLESIAYYRLKMRNDIFKGYAGIFSSDGVEWQKSRSLLNSLLMQTRTVSDHIKPIEEVADSFVKRIEYLSKIDPKNEMPPDFNMEMNRWALESITYAFLGKRLGLLEIHLDDNGKEGLVYLKNLLQFFDFLYKIDIEPSLWRYISTPTWKKYVQVSDDINRFIKKHVDDFKKGSLSEAQSATVINKIFQNNPNYVYGLITDFMLAGVDTTSNATCALLYYVATNQNVQDRLRSEINSVRSDELMRIRMNKMPYLKAVVKESFRLAPVGIGINRQVNVDLNLSGYHVPKGTDLLICNLAIGRKNDFFYDADKFLPERWLREENKKNVLNPWVYLPFGHGPRACVGKRIAILEMEILLYKIVSNFRMSWHHDEMRYKMLLTLSCAAPLTIKMEPI